MKKIIVYLLMACNLFTAQSQWSGNPSVNNILSNKAGNEYNPIAVSDAVNGSLIFFSDQINGDIYAQRITTNGALAWGSSSNPVNVCVTAGQKFEVTAIPDGAGGAYVAWSDYRHDPNIGEIYLQKISSTGAIQWVANGLRVTNNLSSDDLKPVLCQDGLGGVLVTWYGDDAVAQTVQNYAQRYNSAGTALWTANGVQVTTAAGFRASTSILPDGANGAIIFYLDTRNDPNGLNYAFLNVNNLTNTDIYGQRISAAGARLWGNDGSAIITAPGNQNDEIVSDAIADGSGNIILVFSDGRNDPGDYTNYDIFAQKVNSSGVPQWAVNGIPVCTEVGNQFVTGFASDGAGGVVVSMDFESVGRLYAQRITSMGTAAWAVGGVAVSEAGDLIFDGTIVADASGNSIFTFSATNSNTLKAQKLNSAGVLQWGVAGSVVCNNPAANARFPSLTASTAGSVIISWNDSRNNLAASGEDIYVSKVLANGILAATTGTSSVTVSDGNWNSPATWAGGIIPPTGATVVIRHNVTGNINASCASVTVQSPGNLTVNLGIVITITN